MILKNPAAQAILDKIRKHSPEDALALSRAEWARRSLREFIKQGWPVLEPTTPFRASWHIDAVCDHLEAARRGEIKNLLINIPPRCSKSLTIAVFWPMWTWIDAPSFRFLFSSYADTLSTRDSVKSRRLIDSRWFQERWGDRFQLTSDQNQKTRFENNKTGYRLATSVDGSATGEGGDAVVVDDPHKVKGALSDIEREAALIWWDETMSMRLNDQQTGIRVIVMQRLHERDLSGHVLAQGGYTHLMLPMEYEPDRKCVTVIGFEDPRSKRGELLCADRFPPAEVADLKVRLGQYGVSGQLQQRPAPRGGGLFKREWFKVVPASPPPKYRVRAWDFASTEEGGDWSVGTRWSVTPDGVFFIESIIRAQVSPYHLEIMVENTASMDKKTTRIGIFQDPGQAGKYQARLLIRRLVGYTSRAFPAVKGKEQMADPWRAQAEGGNIFLVEGSWNEAFLEELCAFPKGEYDDQVDACSLAFMYLLHLMESDSSGDVAPFVIMKESTWPT